MCFGMRRCLCDEYQHYVFCTHVAMDLIHRGIMKVPPMFMCDDAPAGGGRGAPLQHRVNQFWKRESRGGVFGMGTQHAKKRHRSAAGTSGDKDTQTPRNREGNAASKRSEQDAGKDSREGKRGKVVHQQSALPVRAAHGGVGSSRRESASGAVSDDDFMADRRPSTRRMTGRRQAKSQPAQDRIQRDAEEVLDGAVEHMGTMSLAQIRSLCTGIANLGQSDKDGTGLFVCRRIEAGTPIAILSSGRVSRNPGHCSVRLARERFQEYPAPGKISAQVKACKDAREQQAVLACAGCMANEADSGHEVNAAIAHVPGGRGGQTKREGFTVLVSVRAIEEGEEVLTDYGKGGNNEPAWSHRVQGKGMRED